MKKVQVGIDLGTTNTLACCRVKGKLKLLKFKGNKLLPSVLYVEKQEDGTLKELVGKIADKKGVLDPDHCIRSSKTHIGLLDQDGKPWKWTIYGKEYTPTDVATKILEEVHQKVRDTFDLESDDIVQAVITIPAYFSANQSEETKRAGERAGFEVLRIVTEPVAAAISSADELDGSNEKVFVVDLGGGTFDVSVLEMGEKYTTLAIDGMRDLGGDQFDDALAAHFIRIIEEDLGLDLSSQEKSGLSYQDYHIMKSQIRKAAREVKENLSESEDYETELPELFTYGDGQKYDFQIYIDRDYFNNKLCKNLFDQIIAVIDRLVTGSDKFKKEELKKIFLVGGSCYIPKIQEDVEAYFGVPTDAEQDRETQVAMGAGKIADAWDAGTADQNQNRDPFGDKLVDILSHSMGVEVIGDEIEQEYSEILAKGITYPCEYTNEYKTAYDNQTEVLIEVYEKTNPFASDDIGKEGNSFDFYGSFELTGIKPAPAGAPINVTFEYDQSRTLHVTAEDMINHIKQKVILHKGEKKEQRKGKRTEATDFYLLIDVSASMAGSRINQAKAACVKLIQETLDLNMHRLGLITFGAHEEVLCRLTHDKERLESAVKCIRTSGNTNMSAAIKSANRELLNSSNKKAILLLTDGSPNSRPAAEKASEDAKRNGISIAAIGVQDADTSFLGKIVSGEQLNFMVNDIEKLSDTFGQAVTNLLKK